MPEEMVKQAITDEPMRQVGNKPDELRVARKKNRLLIEGEVDLDKPAMAAIGSLAGAS